jgi:hypothetical protein
VIKHPYHADNLFRLKLIDQTKYKDAQKRFQKRQTKKVSGDLVLAQFQEQGGFICPLSYDAPFQCDQGTKLLVPVPDNTCERINHLSGEQCAEYFHVFGTSVSCDELKKYLTIRISSYLCSLIHKFSLEEANQIERECNLLQQVFQEKAADCGVVLEVSKYLRHLDSKIRSEKLAILQKLDTSEKRSWVFVFSLSGNVKTENHIRIEPTQQYLSAVSASTDRLRMALQTGSIFTAQEQGQNRSKWNNDVTSVHKLNQTSTATKARDADWYHRNDPEKVIDAFKPHIKQLIDAGKSTDPSHLQVGYWVDGISAALVKLKKWDEGKYWLDLFFSLDGQFRKGLPKTQESSMLNRLARCNVQLGK